MWKGDLLKKECTQLRHRIIVSVRRLSTPIGSKSAFVVSLEDAMASRDHFERLRDAEIAYNASIGEWQAILKEMSENRSDPIIRWKLANGISKFESRLSSKWNLQIENLIVALSEEFSISTSSINYMLRFRERFSLKEVKSYHLGWSIFQEVLDIKDEEAMRKCLKLIKSDRIEGRKQIREFKQKVNRG